MKIFLTAATVWTGIVIALIPTPAIATEEIAPVEAVQVVTAVEHSEEIAPRDEITVTAPVEEITAPVEDTPLERIAPTSDIVEPVTVEAEIVDQPAICEPGLILAEDGSCVPASFYETEPEIGVVGATFTLEPCIHEDGSGQVACYWDAASRGNGEGASFVMLEGVFYYSE